MGPLAVLNSLPNSVISASERGPLFSVSDPPRVLTVRLRPEEEFLSNSESLALETERMETPEFASLEPAVESDLSAEDCEPTTKEVKAMMAQAE